MEISTTSDMEAFLRPCFVAFALRPPRDFYEHTAKLIDPGRAHVARDEGAIVGAIGSYSHELAVPGGTVGAAAGMGAGVLPSHRRRGTIAKLHEFQLADIHRRGEALMYAWVSEGAIWGRFGWGVASQALQVAIETRETRLRGETQSSGDVRFVEQHEIQERLAPIYSRIWRHYPGMFLRNEIWWRRRLADPEPYHAVVWEDKAYAIYRVKMDGSSGSFSGEVEVIEALAESAEGYRQIWEYLLSIDLVRKVSAAYLPVDHPLVLMLKDLRRANCRIRDALWIRLVDIEAAMKARAFDQGSIAIRVIDKVLPHNEGTWKLSAEGVAKTATAADLVIDIADLSSVYLNGFTFSDLARSGRVHEQASGAVRRADLMFSWDRKPWCPEQF